MGAPSDSSSTTTLEGPGADSSTRTDVRILPALLDSALSAVSDGVIVVDARAPDQPVIFVNDAFERLTGYFADEVIGRNCRFLQGESTDPADVEVIRDAIRAGRGCTQVLLNHRKDGSTFYNELTLAAIAGEDGEVTHFVGVLNDVTQRVVDDRSIRESEERYRSLINAMSDGVVMQSSSGQIVAANPRAEEILGLSADQLRGETSIDRDPWCLRADGTRFPGEEHPAMVTLATGKSVHDVIMGVVHTDGEVRWISINSEPVHPVDYGDAPAVVTSFTDITERRHLESEQTSLRRVAEAIAAERSNVFDLIAEELARLTDANAAAVLRFVDERDGIIEGGWFRDQNQNKRLVSGARLPLPPEGEALKVRQEQRTRRSQWRTDSGAPMAELGFTETVTTPIFVDGEVWGAMGVSTGDDRRIADSAELRLERFSELATLAVSSERTRASLASQAERDPLTGLLNHRVFHERLRTEVARAMRHDRPLSLALIDIDSFKQANDSVGHRVGDEMLREVGERLAGTARSEDIVARVGGDEFALILPEGTEMDAYVICERVRTAISATSLNGATSVTASVGICGFEHAQNERQMYELADGALYWAKAHGRNQSFIYDPAVVRELSAQERLEQLRRSQAMVGLQALARAIDAKDHATRQHSERVARFATLLATEAGWADDQVALLHEAALVHDVGKIGIPDEILLKPGRLTREEYTEVKRHALLGAEIVEGVLLPLQVAWVRSHHERPDGTGYPDGLDADSIPDGASLLATADCFDVMTASRSYSPPMSVDDAIAEVNSLRDLQFAGFTVDALTTLFAAGSLTDAARMLDRTP